MMDRVDQHTMKSVFGEAFPLRRMTSAIPERALISCCLQDESNASDDYEKREEDGILNIETSQPSRGRLPRGFCKGHEMLFGLSNIHSGNSSNGRAAVTHYNTFDFILTRTHFLSMSIVLSYLLII